MNIVDVDKVTRETIKGATVLAHASRVASLGGKGAPKFSADAPSNCGAVVADGTDDIEEPKVPEMDDDVLDAPGAETVASNPSSHPRLSEVKEDIVIGSAKTTSTTHRGASAVAGAASGDVSRGHRPVEASAL